MYELRAYGFARLLLEVGEESFKSIKVGGYCWKGLELYRWQNFVDLAEASRNSNLLWRYRDYYEINFPYRKGR